MRKYRLALVLVLTYSAGAGLIASPAHAEGEDRALALDLFEEGRALFKKGDYVAALTKFEAAGHVMRTFGILLNIAECQEKLGRTASAWATWREARAVAAEGHKGEDEAMAAEREKSLEPKLVRLTLVVPVLADAPELEIQRDTVVVPRAAWGSGLPVDPGEHILEERAPGRKPRKIAVVVPSSGPGATVTMTALEAEPRPPASASPPLLVTAPAPPPASPSAPPLAPVVLVTSPPPRTDRDTGSAQRGAGWLLVGLGIAGAGAGTAIAIAGQSKHNDAVATDLGGDVPLAQSEEATANTMKIAGYATLGGGGAFLLSGVILLLTAHSPSSNASSAARLEPWISPTILGGGFSTEW
jgi:hypothetical protein